MRIIHKIFLSMSGLIIFIAIVTMLNTPIFAQSQWTPQARIPNYDDLVGEKPPYLIADQNRTVHAFNSQTLDDDRVIMYRQWTLEDGWTSPVDIFIAPQNDSIELLDVYLDPNYNVHLIYQVGKGMYYSRAPLIDAYKAYSWLPPVLLQEGLSFPSTASISGINVDDLVIIYGGDHEGRGVYAITSTNGGDDWQEVTPVFLIYDDTATAIGIQLYSGKSGLIHAVWSVVNEKGHGVGGYYAQFEPASGKWSEAIELDTVADPAEATIVLGILMPAVVEYENDIFVSYYSGNVNSNWWRRSRDGGRTWSDPIRVSPHHVGTNGALSFVVDGKNTLHAFFGQRINDLNHGMWHVIWSVDHWSEPVPVVSGPQIRDEIGGRGFDPKSARAVIVQGNIVLVTWITDGIAGENGVWYAATTIDALQLPIATLPVLPTITPAFTPVPTATSMSPISPIAINTPNSFGTELSTDISVVATNNPLQPIFISTMLVVLMVFIIIVVRKINNHI